MLINAKALRDYKLLGLDGEIGAVKDFYFDDRNWRIRYLIAGTGGWPFDKQVLVSPATLNDIIKDVQDIGVNLTTKQIEDGPSLDTDEPVSHQYHEAYHGFYNSRAYLAGSQLWGSTPEIVNDPKQPIDPSLNMKSWDPHLRSTREVRGYHIQAKDGEIGYVSDFVIDVKTWTIRYLVVDTRAWWSGKRVLMSPKWIHKVSFGDRSIVVDLDRDEIKGATEYAGDASLDRQYEIGLHRHYGRQGYWVNGEAPIPDSSEIEL